MTSDATEPADAPEPEAAPPRDSRGRFTPRADADGEAAEAETEADAREAADAEADAAPPGAPPPDAPAPLPPNALPQMVATISIGDRLRDYATRLAWAGAQPLAAAVDGYAARVEGVARGDRPPSAAANPSALTPTLVGEALGGNRVADFLEPIRNVLIFAPVLWTWFEFGLASRGYEGVEPSFLLYWQQHGLYRTIIVAVCLLVVMIAVNVALGLARAADGRKEARTAREFAALLAEAEGVGAGQRNDDPQEAIAAFASAGHALTDELRGTGRSLASSVQPLADSVDIARAVMGDMSAAVERQQGQLAVIVDSLAGVSAVAERLGALERSFAEMRDAARENAVALDAIRASLDPRTEELSRAVDRVADLASRMERAAEQIARATEDYGKSLTGFADGAAQLQKAATTMNEVAIRLRDDMASST